MTVFPPTPTVGDQVVFSLKTYEWNGSRWISIGAELNASNLVAGTVAVARGGTGSSTASAARTALGVPATNHDHSGGNITSGLVADAYVDLRVDSGVTFDGQGSVIAGSKTVLVPIERACVISAVSIVGDVSGSITVDLQRYTPTGFGTLGSPTTLGSIALSSSQHTRDTTLSGWTKSLSVGDVLSFTTSGTIATVTRVTVKTKLETS